MLQTLKLLLPALFPSWRFFDEIGPSPRIEFALLKAAHDAARNWHAFRPRPRQLSVTTLLRRLFWNPHWNETLFVGTCAERLMQEPSEHRIREIVDRIAADLADQMSDLSATPFLQFRLVFITREGTELREDVTFVSEIVRTSKSAVA
jgi:hypothetical protein